MKGGPPCTMGVGCDEAGICYAAAVGSPEMCPRKDAPNVELSLVERLRRLLSQASEPAPKFQRKPGGLKGGLTRDERQAVDDWKYRTGLARGEILETVPSLLACIEALEKALTVLASAARSAGQHFVYNAPTQELAAALEAAEAALSTLSPAPVGEKNDSER